MRAFVKVPPVLSCRTSCWWCIWKGATNW